MARIRTTALLALAGLSLGAGPALANYTWRHELETTEARPATAEHYAVDDEREIRVRVRDGEIRAWVNGKELPADRIVVEPDGRTMLLDENGRVFHELITGDTFVMTAPRGRGVPGWVVRNNNANENRDEVVVVEGAPLAPGRGLARLEVSAGLPPVMIGINHTGVSDALRHHLELPEKAIIIERVIEGLPAAEAGMRRYDILVEIEGQEGASATELTRALRDKSPGDELKVVVRRGSQRIPMTLELRAYDASALGAATPTAPGFPVPPTPPGGEREAYREMVERLRGPFDGLMFRLEDDRLVLPDEQEIAERIMRFEREIEAMSPEIEAEIEARLEAFERRMEAFEARLERELGSIFERLERSLVRMERAMEEREERDR